MKGINVEDRRKQEREKVNEPAYITGDGSSLRCHVVNLSEHGAAIDVPNVQYIRQRFDLMLERDRIVRKCHLIWSSGNRVGVEFLD